MEPFVFYIGEPGQQIQVSVDNEGGTLKWTFSVVQEDGFIADLRGIFFDWNAEDGTEIGAPADLQISDIEVLEGRVGNTYEADVTYGEDNVINLGQGNNMSGTGYTFDIGMAISDAGIGKKGEDVQSVTFLMTAEGGLTMDALQNLMIGLRLTSVGTEGINGPRGDSLKLVEAVPDIPHPPVAADDAVEGTEDAALLSMNLLANDADIDNDHADLFVQSVTINDLPLVGLTAEPNLGAPTVDVPSQHIIKLNGEAFGILTVSSEGLATFAPDEKAQKLQEGQNISLEFEYTVSDGRDTDTALATFTITGLNDAPVANEDSVTGTEDATLLSMDLLANDTDIDNDHNDLFVTGISDISLVLPGRLSIMEVEISSGIPAADILSERIIKLNGEVFGTLTVSSEGLATFAPGERAQGLETNEDAELKFRYTVSDEHGGEATASATFTIEGLNDDPGAGDPVVGDPGTNDSIAADLGAGDYVKEDPGTTDQVAADSNIASASSEDLVQVINNTTTYDQDIFASKAEASIEDTTLLDFNTALPVETKNTSTTQDMSGSQDLLEDDSADIDRLLEGNSSLVDDGGERTYEINHQDTSEDAGGEGDPEGDNAVDVSLASDVSPNQETVSDDPTIVIA